MPPQDLTARSLERRRKELGISRTALARLSGVSLPSTNRMLNDGIDKATLSNVRAVTSALGMEMTVAPTCSSLELQQQQARAKAKKIVELVQGTSALESQAVDRQTVQDMMTKTVYELMSGSKRRLWST